MRLIDADALQYFGNHIGDEYEDDFHDAQWIYRSQIDNAPTIGTWIPCSERLPERTDKYLVTVENGNVYAGTFSTFDNRFTCKAVAWMELPEPYRGGDDSGKE